MTTESLEVDLSKVAERAAPAQVPPLFAALAGLVAGAVAVTIGMLVAGIIEVVSPIDAVGSEFIDHVPPWLKRWAIDNFGTNDKLALRVGIFTVIGLIAVVLGFASARRRWLVVGGIGVFGVLGAVVAAQRPNEGAAAVIPSLLGAIVGMVLVHRLLRPAPSGPRATPGPSQVPLGWDRRRFLVTSGTAAAVAVVAGGTARSLENRRVSDIRADIPDTVPPAQSTLPLLFPAAQADGAVPFITPNDDFYRIDTALSFPRVELANWKLTIDGMVDRPLTVTYDQLLARPQVERMVTLCCVSNPVGGDLVGNAVWQGVLLKDLLDEAGVRPGADQVFSHSLDGWTCGFPVAVALDGRDAMVVTGMNGQGLPLEHGFPARLVVPGLYGYVSATKWLKRIELTTFDEAVGYWVPLGWARDGPVKTQSRIDVPRRGSDLPAGTIVVAGIAFAQHRGIDKVEVRVDGGDWQPATLADNVTDDAWRQWRYEWAATAGDHTLQVRATDRTGEAQTEDVAPPDPDGATGYHTRKVHVY